MKKNQLRNILLVILVGLMLSWGVYECKYYYIQWSDFRNKPWAYSRDENAKLLVGNWGGTFTDPDKVAKTIQLEILVPSTEDERRGKASERWKRASFSTRNKRSFDGTASVQSTLGTENYEIYGAVEEDDFHKLHISFRSEDDTDRVLPNFTILEAREGTWHDDSLAVKLSFNYQRKDGSSFWNSADPRFDKKVSVTLTRKLK